MTAEAQTHRERLRCSVTKIDDIFDGCLREAQASMSPKGVDDWIDGATRVCGLGRGTELVLIFLEEIPGVVRATDESIIPEIADTAELLSKAAVGPALNPFLATLPGVARRLRDADLLGHWLDFVCLMANAAPRGVVPMLGKIGHLLDQLSIGGLRNWIAYGLRTYKAQPWRHPEYFGLATPDSLAAMQRERHGTLYVDNERQLRLWLRSLWGLEIDFRPYSLAFVDPLYAPRPHVDKLGIHIPDVYDDLETPSGTISGIDRYRAMVAHMAGHHLWSTPYLADNFSAFQHLAIEAFEDSRIEALAMRRYPGLRRLFKAMHPIPKPGACPEGVSCIRHKLTMLSRAILDPDHAYDDPSLLEYVAKFHARFAERPFDAKWSLDLGVEWLGDNYEHDFRKQTVWFEDTRIPYRDDNRYLWVFLEDTDDEDEFHSDHGHSAPEEEEGDDDGLLPPQHYPEWDHEAQQYRPDWATVHESRQTQGRAGDIDALLERHGLLAKRLKQVVDLLKPHQRRRIRYQEEGDEMDLDVLIRAMTDYRSGAEPENRVQVRYEKAGRNIALLLLLDLSQSITEVPAGARHSILQLSQEAVSLLGWTVDALGDKFAIAGFASNTRHEVRYTHFKGFDEPWGEAPKGRLAAMEAGYSTRMGAALRHAARYLEGRREEKKLLFLLTDGEPSDIDVSDEGYLKADTHVAVGELKRKGIDTFCITLDPKADDYVEEIFGPARYTVVDRVELLPEKLSRLFMSLTK